MADNIDVRGIPCDELFAALYNASHAVGMGLMHDLGTVTAEDLKARCGDKLEGDCSFDYVFGHPFKIQIREDKIDTDALFDRDNGRGALVRAVEQLRKRFPAPDAETLKPTG